MMYLFFQTWTWILAAALVGLVTGWMIWGRNAGARGQEIRYRLQQLRNRSVQLEPGEHSVDKTSANEFPKNTVLHARDL
jgi:hypothetical protein